MKEVVLKVIKIMILSYKNQINHKIGDVKKILWHTDDDELIF
jgi:hypothetical protein